VRPALRHGCGKQTPSASLRILFFRANLLYVSDPKIGLCTTLGQLWDVRSRSVHSLGKNLQSCAQICYMFLIPKCRGESDIGLCTTLGLAKRMPLRSAAFRVKHVFGARFVGSQHCATAFFLQVLKLCTDLDRTLLYILILRTYTKFVWKK